MPKNQVPHTVERAPQVELATLSQLKELVAMMAQPHPRLTKNYMQDFLRFRLQTQNLPTRPALPDINWPVIYRLLGMPSPEPLLAKVSAPNSDDIWVIPMLKGLSIRTILHTLGRIPYTYHHPVNSNGLTNQRDPVNSSYVVCVNRSLVADLENKGKSSGELERSDIPQITLLEYIMLWFGCYITNGIRLDEDDAAATICAGSFYTDDGRSPVVLYDKIDGHCLEFQRTESSLPHGYRSRTILKVLG